MEKQIFSSQWLLNLLFFAGSDGAAADIPVGRVLATRYELIYQHVLKTLDIVKNLPEVVGYALGAAKSINTA